MKIERITYQKAFITGPFLQEKIGFEAEIDEHIQSVHNALMQLKSMAEDFHKEANPHLYQDVRHDGFVQDTNYKSPPSVTTYTTIPIISKDTERLKDTIEDMILECKSMEELAALKPSATANGLIPQYMNKLKELSI